MVVATRRQGVLLAPIGYRPGVLLYVYSAQDNLTQQRAVQPTMSSVPLMRNPGLGYDQLFLSFSRQVCPRVNDLRVAVLRLQSD